MVQVDKIEKLGSKDFTVSIFNGKKKFFLKAKNLIERNDWFDMIQQKSILYKSLVSQAVQGRSRVYSKDSWKMDNQNLNVLRKIQTEHEQKGNYMVNTKFQTDEILETKGILKYTRNISKEMFEARSCMGWLTMKS